MSSAKKRVPVRPEGEEPRLPRCLVSMPFGEEWTDQVYRKIETIMESMRVKIFTVDRTEREDLDILKDVAAQIRSADIVIADVTGRNANVYLEIGYALANEKPILYVTQNKSDVSSLVSQSLYHCYTLSQGGLDDLARFLLLRIREVLDRLRIEQERLELEIASKPIYQAQCFKDRSLVNLESFFAEAGDRIDILTTNLSWLCEKIKGSDESYLDTIMAALKLRCSLKVRILTLDPQSELAERRGRQLGFSPENFRNQLCSARDEVKSRGAAYSGRFEGRIYRELPTQITFRVDEKVFTCVVGQPRQSRFYPVIEFHIANPGVEEGFVSHFTAVWIDADPM